MKTILCCFVSILLGISATRAQILKKIKDKVNKAVDKTIDKTIDKPAEKPAEKPTAEPTKEKEEEPKTNETAEVKKVDAGTSSYKVYSKFDFIPGKTILYFDNFEKDNIGETPEGWMTTNVAEVVKIEGLEGNWITLNAKGGARNIIRNKKQSWGDNYSVEFDIFMDPEEKRSGNDLYIILANSMGKLVTDETLLGNNLFNEDAIMIAAGIERTGEVFRLTTGKGMGSNSAGGKKFSDEQGLKLLITMPVHISICVQGKRLRFWWNNKKMLDVNSAISPEAIPNLLAFTAHYNTNTKFYLGNIRIAKDIPDTRLAFEQGKIISNLLFFSGTAKLKPESMGALYDVSKVIKDATNTVKIIGHTDSDGDDALNMKLSNQRAETVKDILVKEYGIDESKLTTEGRGETQPIADNKSAEGKAQNRRVEFIFKPEADTYIKPATTPSGANAKASEKTAKPVASTQPETSGLNNAPGTLSLQSKLLNIILPFTQIMKGENNTYVLLASKEEGNNSENYLQITFKPIAGKLAPGTYNFNELNQKNPSYGIKELPEITGTKSVLYYGAGKKPYISSFVPFFSTEHESKYYASSFAHNPPPPLPECKLVIESVKEGKASGYFVMGIKTEGNSPVKIGDAMTRTFTGKYGGQMKGMFKDIPVY
ncbi:MAG: OmpA family protein [Chitinophagaceae bacterium]|nr:OmpA family protein [Chitinophagaceae bacterium]